MYMIEKDVISQLVEEKLASSGNYLVDVVIKPGNLIIIEIDNDEGVCIDDCAELSRYVEGHLDRVSFLYNLLQIPNLYYQPHQH